MEIRIEPVIFYLVLLLNHFTDSTQYNVGNEKNSVNTASLDTLEFVAVVARHGSRSSSRTYPNDPYPFDNRLFWPNGPVQLTTYGMKQLFQIGENLRKRYSGFLPLHFHPDDTVVEYNDNDRDYASGACALAALYPPIGNEVWNPDLLWQPIPLHIRKYDLSDAISGNECPYLKAESNALVTKKEQELMKNKTIVELLKKVSSHTGSNITSISELTYIYDILTMQEENGFTLPLWTKDYFPEPMRLPVSQLVINSISGTENVLRLGVGPELKYISDMLNMKANRTYESNRKLYIETAHDGTLIIILKALGNNDPYLEARTSAHVIFELHYISPLHIVQVLHYQNSSDINPEYINITGCPSPCSLEKFTKLVDSINPANRDEICHEKN